MSDSRPSRIFDRRSFLGSLKRVRDALARPPRTGASSDREQDDPISNRERFAAIVKDQTRTLGSDHPETLKARTSLAHYTGQAGDHESACNQLTAVVNDQTRVRGYDDPDTLRSRYELASHTGKAGNPRAARDQSAEVVKAQTRVLGFDHRSTMQTRNKLGHYIGEAGDPIRARDLLAEVVKAQTRVLGANHSDTESTRDLLIYWERLAESAVEGLAVREFALHALAVAGIALGTATMIAGAVVDWSDLIELLKTRLSSETDPEIRAALGSETARVIALYHVSTRFDVALTELRAATMSDRHSGATPRPFTVILATASNDRGWTAQIDPVGEFLSVSETPPLDDGWAIRLGVTRNRAAENADGAVGSTGDGGY
jgi:hypothetical protein